MKRVLLTVKGKVQGVCFRRFTQQKAQSLGVTCYVRNKEDGSVEVLAQGAFPAVDHLIAWCEQGPPQARVDGVYVEEDEADEIYLDFSISD
ncbi:acylphosphatase [Shewanella algae]|uniref:acylphosphatase n=1 Tax=Shewanella algae TaxID=38313 RepID=UPI001AAF96FC|nr:acylphosphatase [Shewanella algae]MBO2663060.1 acylphosphatase [Shewanella algae]MCL1053231.1 acylphosphatase [Shewanella algae]